MIILCMDGIDSDYADKLGLHLPYEAKLTIPKQLYQAKEPHTLHVWASIFTGKIRRHPELDESLRIQIRAWLIRHNISWKRKPNKEIKGRVFNKSVEYNETIFSQYHSFIYEIPGIVDGFLLGGTQSWARRKHRLFNILANTVPSLGYELIALYTHSPDYECHRGISVDPIYRQGFLLAELLMKKYDVMLLSDHGCVEDKHTDYAYLGTNFPFKAKTVLDVRKVIEERIEIKKD